MRFSVQRFDTQGNSLLSKDDIDHALVPFVGSAKTLADVQQAARSLEELFLERGYGSVRVLVPEQDVTAGIVRLRIVERRVGKVTVEGNQAFGANNIRYSLPAFRENQVPNLNEVARNLQLTAEHPSKQTTVMLRAGASEDVVDVGIRVVDEKPWKFIASLDNTGTAATGYYRAGAGFQHSNLFDRDHTLTAQYVTSPTYASRVTILGVGYKIPFYERNSSLDLVLGYSDVNSGMVQGLFSVAGSGTVATARWNWMMPRWGEAEQKLSFGLDYKAFQNKVTFQDQSIVPDITVHPISVNYTAVHRGARSELSVSGGLSFNVPGGNDGKLEDFQRTRAAASDRYSIFRYGMNYVRQMWGEWQGRIALGGQHTSDALVPGEQFGLGGADTVRGYQLREVTSDRGYAVQIELYTPEIGKKIGLPDNQRLRLVAFADGGSVWRNHALPGELMHDSIGSAGIGARWSAGKTASLRVDIAQVLQATPNRRLNSQRIGAALALSF